MFHLLAKDLGAKLPDFIHVERDPAVGLVLRHNHQVGISSILETALRTQYTQHGSRRRGDCFERARHIFTRPAEKVVDTFYQCDGAVYNFGQYLQLLFIVLLLHLPASNLV